MFHHCAHRKLGMFVALAALAALAALLIPASHAAAQGGRPNRVERDKVRVGDVIATGTLNAYGLCEFGPIEVITETNPGGQTKYFAVEANEACELVAVGKWNGRLQDGPADVVEPILNESDWTSVEGTPLGSESSEDSLAAPSRARNSAALATGKTSEARVWTYGYGGTSDVLTQIRGSLTFFYDYINVWASNRASTCYAATWTRSSGWEWRIDSCYWTVPSTGSNEVGVNHYGSYHCHDLPGGANPCGGATGYYHTIKLNIVGRSNGSSSCSWWVNGSWVLGPTGTIVKGCS